MQNQSTRKPKRKVAIPHMDKKRIVEILESTPDVRKNKIAAIKKAIAEGSYQIKAEDIASKMLKELIFEIKR
jgi:flagellar biosynthesis anti-sigma factor FlgM